MKNSIKRAQSRAGSSFAERENFRPKVKQLKKTILTLVALIAVTAGAWADGIVCTASDLGKVLCTDGSIYENVSAATTAGKTAAAVIAYVDETNKNSLAIALSDEGEMNWSTAKSTCEGKTAVSGAAWLLPSLDQWRAMFKAFGGNERSYTGLNTAITTAGGTALQGLVYYWSSTEEGGDYAYSVYLVGGSGGADWYDDRKSGSSRVRACLAFDIAAAPSGPEVAWDKAKKTGSFTMPGGNVTLEPEYYPQAALTAAPTAIDNVPATTDGAIVNAGTVANIGSTETAQGTVMYYVSQTALDDAALLALAADAWTADVPTAAHLAAGEVHVYYYVRGNDSDTDEENFSDGDILSANALTVNIAAAPTYAVTFADDLAEPDKWTASPAANVTKGETVTVTYTGTKKVIGVKAEKKAAELSHALADAVVGEIVGTDGKAYAVADKDNLPDGVTAAGMVAYKSGSNGLVIALTDEASSTNWSIANGTSGAAAHTPTVTGYSWQLPSQAEWRQMFSANGGDEGNYIGLNTALGNAGGTALRTSKSYWSSTVDTKFSGRAYTVFLSASGTATSSNSDEKDYDGNYVRACLAF